MLTVNGVLDVLESKHMPAYSTHGGYYGIRWTDSPGLTAHVEIAAHAMRRRGCTYQDCVRLFVVDGMRLASHIAPFSETAFDSLTSFAYSDHERG